MTKQRLDQFLVTRKLTTTRSQAENLIRLGKVRIGGRVVSRPGTFVEETAVIALEDNERYVSRAGLKLASVAERLNISFQGKVVLDVGSSTGGFTDYALQHGAKKVFAVDVGTEQLHPSLRSDKHIELHEKTDIRDVVLASSLAKFSETASLRNSSLVVPPPDESGTGDVSENLPASGSTVAISSVPDIIVMDVSFISLREILPHVAKLSDKDTQIVAMLKPQFEAGREQVNKGVIKNDSVRRQILKDFEAWAKQYFVIANKQDSKVSGAKGNKERFYLLYITRIVRP